MTDQLLRCGRISYTNDLPIYAAFDAGAVECPATLVAGVPTALNRMLLAGELDVSPISSFFCAQHASEFRVIPGVCIGSLDAVRSIYLISQPPPASLAGVPIAVTDESSTGRNLFATVCAERHGFVPAFVTMKDPYGAHERDGAPCLVIGDKAIDAYLRTDPTNAYDVGSLWHDATGTHMVYALWAVRREVAERRPAEVDALARSLTSAMRWGTSHRDKVIAAAQAAIARPENFYLDYYRTLTFDFDREAWHGLETFYALAAKHGLLSGAPALKVFEKDIARV